MRSKMQLLPALVALFILVTVIPSATAASVDPVLIPGNPTCEDIGCCNGTITSFKIDSDPDEGSYDNGNITISNKNGSYFDWSSTNPVCAVIVKGGPNANVYCYNDTEVTSDTGLVTPINPANGQPYNISHVEFCYSDENGENGEEIIDVNKTAVTSYNRTHNWSIDKSVDTENGYTEDGFDKIWLYINGSGDENATWDVNVTYNGYEDSDYKVEGVITIINSGSTDATITGIVDELSGTPVDVDCGVTFPYILPAGENLTCTYSEDVDSMVEGFNNVTVTTNESDYDAQAEIIWGEPDEELYSNITVSDLSDLFGSVELGTLNAADYDEGDVETFTYSEEFAWDDYGADGCGDFVYNNTATIEETGQSDSATLRVNVQCYDYETAYAKGDDAICFIDEGFSNWGWTNPIGPGTYEWDLWAAAGGCDTNRGTLVGTVTVVYDAAGNVDVTYNVEDPYILDETHVYAGYSMFPVDNRGNPTVAPGQYTNNGPFNGSTVYVIVHGVVGIPDPDFGP